MPHEEQPDQLYIWLDSNPQGELATHTIEDTPGVSDLDLIATALIEGRLGRYLPVTITFATHPEPQPNKVRSIDTARLLRDRDIPHRRRYEIVLPEDAGQ